MKEKFWIQFYFQLHEDADDEEKEEKRKDSVQDPSFYVNNGMLLNSCFHEVLLQFVYSLFSLWPILLTSIDQSFKEIVTKNIIIVIIINIIIFPQIFFHFTELISIYFKIIFDEFSANRIFNFFEKSLLPKTF